MKHVVIIGNGISGITAARHIRKCSDCRITVISSETPHFFSRTALMYVYMGHLTFEHTKPYEDWFWKKNRIDLIFDHAEHFNAATRTVVLRSGRTVAYDDLILATGSRSNFLGIPNENLLGVQALYSYQDLLTMDASTRGIRRAVVVGGGLIGVELAEMLHSRNIDVTIVIRETAFWNNVLPLPEARMISRHIASHGIALIHDDEVAEILDNGQGRVSAIRTSKGHHLECDFLGIAVGVRPNIEWLQKTDLALGNGVLVNEFLETNLPQVYAVGDCVERRSALEGRKRIEQVWYTARMMGEVVARTICGERTPYQPGPWFNSAKFFNIEFQTYGNIGNRLRENEAEFYWEHRSGRKAMHFTWTRNNGRLCGVNSFGIRLRHENFDRWLREQRDIRFVMDHLREANFDPEFAARYEQDILRLFLHQESAVTEQSPDI